MKEIYQNIFLETITYPDRHMSPRNLMVVKTPGRSLMVDTACPTEHDWKALDGMLKKLEIDYDKLDIFVTHDHPDHSGLVPELCDRGARVFMSPVERITRADLLHCYLVDRNARVANFRTVGVTPEKTPEVYQTMMEYTDRLYQANGGQRDFPYHPIRPGDVLRYGEYRFRVISLKGHTIGQCGLYEPEHELLFCGDQIMTTIVPIVGSQQKDWGLLKCYLNSLAELKDKYSHCRFLPCHYGPIRDVSAEVERIARGYMEKCSIMRGVLEESGELMTTRDVGVLSYGRSMGPPDFNHFVSCTQIWAKTFSCLEYMYGECMIRRSERDGIVYWQRK